MADATKNRSQRFLLSVCCLLMMMLLLLLHFAQGFHADNQTIWKLKLVAKVLQINWNGSLLKPIYVYYAVKRILCFRLKIVCICLHWKWTTETGSRWCIVNFNANLSHLFFFNCAFSLCLYTRIIIMTNAIAFLFFFSPPSCLLQSSNVIVD